MRLVERSYICNRSPRAPANEFFRNPPGTRGIRVSNVASGTHGSLADTDRGIRANFDRQGRAIRAVIDPLCVLPKRRSKGVASFVLSHWRAKQAWICFLVSIEWRSSPVRLITSIIAGWRELVSGRSWWSLAPLAVARFGVVGRMALA